MGHQLLQNINMKKEIQDDNYFEVRRAITLWWALQYQFYIFYYMHIWPTYLQNLIDVFSIQIAYIFSYILAYLFYLYNVGVQIEKKSIPGDQIEIMAVKCRVDEMSQRLL